MHTKPLLLLLLLCLSYTSALAQKDYMWRATVPAPEKQGFHSIMLSPEVTGRMRPDLADIRLYNAQQQEVPYLLRTEESLRYNQLFRPYSILHYRRQAGCCSELLIENPEKRKISNLSLLIKNADVQKQVSLSGSDNQKDWYVLKAQDVLHTINSTESTAKLKLLEFPLNDYRYLRLQLNDSTSAPLNILQAGYYDTQREAGKYTAIPIQQITRTDSAKHTYLKLQFSQPVYPEQLELKIASPALYLREGYIITDRTATTRKRRRRQSAQASRRAPFTFTSKEPARIVLPRQQLQELTIVIDNADNQPLKIEDVTVLQLNRYLVANLDAGESYSLYFGDADATAPAYDLKFFRDSISADLPVLLPRDVVAVEEQQQDKGWSTSKLLIWAAIGVVVAGLGYMTVRLLNEMGREKK